MEVMWPGFGTGRAAPLSAVPVAAYRGWFSHCDAGAMTS